jgi:site-specific DNA-cytosine methylase
MASSRRHYRPTVDYPLAGNVDDKYKQTGNSVVPHVARLIGDAVLEMIHAAR